MDRRCDTEDEVNDVLNVLVSSFMEGNAASIAAEFRGEPVTVFGHRSEQSFIPVAIVVSAGVADKLKPLFATHGVAKDTKPG